MYLLEVEMGRDNFYKSDKASITPFYPLITYPDASNEDIYLLTVQKRTTVDVIEKSKQDIISKVRPTGTIKNA
jgi:hypothetical protein